MLQINGDRFLGLMDAQAQIGATVDGGLSRPAFSEADGEIRHWFEQQVNAAGLEFRKDGAANLSAVLPSKNPDAKTLLIGSHLDSVIHGGRYDGALGVLSAFEAVRTIQDAQLDLPFHLECISFSDEESRHIALLGSSAVSGQLNAASFNSLRSNQTEWDAGLQRVGITENTILSAKRDDILGYMEVHIEQGTRLEESGLDVGVVTSIVGIRGMWLHFVGEAAHAGTMPIAKRHDAFLGAADFTLQARQIILDNYLPGVVNVGQVQLKPGAFNIVPSEVSIAVEFRHGDEVLLDAMERELVLLAKRSVRDYQLELTIEPLVKVTAAPMDETLMSYVEDAVGRLGLRHTRLMSFAGHDPQSIAKIAPCAMYFVPSEAGISHNPREYTRPQDCVNAANVLLQAVLRVAEAESA